MLQYAPETLPVVSQKHVVPENSEPSFIETEQNTIDNALRLRRRTKLAKGALIAGLAIHLPIALYMSDVSANMEAVSKMAPTIEEIAPATDPLNNTVTIFYDGFNTFGAHNLVHYLGPSVQEAYEGEQWSIQYNNAPLDAARIASIVNEKIAEKHITSVNVVSYSMGDQPGTENAVDVINNSWTNVESINILSGPSSYDGLTDSTKNELAIAKGFSWIPWVEYSTPFRYLAELYFYRDNFKNQPIKTISEINERFDNNEVTTGLFISSQINAIADANIPAEIEKIDPNKFQPVINYIKIKEGQDSVVNNEYSAEAICAAAFKMHLHCNVVEVNSEHSQYYQTTDVYTEAFQELSPIVAEQVAEEKADYAARLYAAQHDGSLSLLAPNE